MNLSFICFIMSLQALLNSEWLKSKGINLYGATYFTYLNRLLEVSHYFVGELATRFRV